MMIPPTPRISSVYDQLSFSPLSLKKQERSISFRSPCDFPSRVLMHVYTRKKGNLWSHTESL
jgi:hypothetical protein